MMPLALIAGFLGSGKTTLLKNLLARKDGGKALFLVNEFADDDVDATLVADAGGMARAVSGGSVFCVCKADEFKDRLVEAAAMPGLDGVVVEASGMAEPRAMGKILSDPRIAGAFSLSSLIAVVDPATFPKLVHTLPAIRGQVADADRILVNKCDIAPPEAVERVRRQLAEINPNAAIVETVMARADFDPFAPARSGRGGLEAELTGCGDRSFESVLAAFSAPVPLSELAAALGGLGGLVARVKGWLNTPDQGRLFVEMAGSGNVSAQPAAAGPSRLVVIVKANAGRAVRNRLGALPGAVFPE